MSHTSGQCWSVVKTSRCLTCGYNILQAQAIWHRLYDSSGRAEGGMPHVSLSILKHHSYMIEAIHYMYTKCACTQKKNAALISNIPRFEECHPVFGSWFTCTLKYYVGLQLQNNDCNINVPARFILLEQILKSESSSPWKGKHPTRIHIHPYSHVHTGTYAIMACSRADQTMSFNPLNKSSYFSLPFRLLYLFVREIF